ncbi:MAG: succinylglutamate-semialdehyde dehydrogenase [Bdellovibrionales bacterium]|nr:succinylglutamate-semialdehyde dehydrogenase [Bdellovibrionales bacterium]
MTSHQKQNREPYEKINFLGDFIEGRFALPEKPEQDWIIRSPADLKDEVLHVESQNDHVERACLAAKAAFPVWSQLNLDKRFLFLYRLKEVYQSHAEPWAKIISRETGKPLWEAKNEVSTMINKIDITLKYSMKLVEEEKVAEALPGVEGYIRYKPRGVMAVLGPFNFPGHLPNGHIIPALACGNTIVFKPSEKTPATGQFMAEMFHKAEFPPGVFNLVQGQSEVGKRLSGSEYVDGVLFTGSYEVGLKIKQETLHHFWKILALEMGGKNATVVWEDADLQKAVYETLIGSFLSAGQRCSCTSRILVHKKIKDTFVDHFYSAAKKLSIGHWQENVFMGPLIGADAVEKYIRFQEIAKREGAESLMRGKSLELDEEGHYVTPSINLVPKFDSKSVYQKSEIFAPNVAIYTVEEFEEAMMINNSTGFGLAMALFSKNKSLYERAQREARVGLLNWNRTTNGASSRLPFGGLGKSGNDRPSAHFAVQYCATPMASLEDESPLDKNKLLPGTNFEF